MVIIKKFKNFFFDCSRLVHFPLLPLKLIFQITSIKGVFPENWEESNVVPVHKKESKSLTENYRPTIVLPIFSKMYKRLIFNSILNYFIRQNLPTKCHSRFFPGHLCISQLLSITHEILKSFDCNPPLDTRRTFLHISKAFYIVRYDGLLFKLRPYRVEGVVVMDVVLVFLLLIWNIFHTFF